jgi:hypothetical protein
MKEANDGSPKGRTDGPPSFSINTPLFPLLVFSCSHHWYSIAFTIVSFLILLLPIVFVFFDTSPCRDHSIPLV